MSACHLINTHCVWYQLCKLRAELTRLRSSVERGEAQRLELQYQLTVSQRNEEQVFKLTGKQIMCTFSSKFFFFFCSLDSRVLFVSERAAELQQTVQELQKALEITRQARGEDRHALQQEMEERDGLIQSFTSENQQLQRLLQVIHSDTSRKRTVPWSLICLLLPSPGP